MLERSIVVVAHPDDEVLWFSSILEKVDAVVVCFISNEAYPKWNAGRRQSLMDYPIKNIECLDLDESGVLNGSNWKNQVETDYGLEIVQESIPAQRIEKYKNNFEILKQRLVERLEGYQNVFTHNPWGEYGHEEHVQVHRVITTLQNTMGFTCWYSNYVADKSFAMMSRYRERVRFDGISFETNPTLARKAKEIYKRNGCWTWHDNWEWFKKETFIKELPQPKAKTYGRLFPINYIKVGKTAPPSKIRRTVKSIARNFTNTLGIEIHRKPTIVRERVVTLQPQYAPHGSVLLSWYVEPFLLKPGEPLSTSHTVFWDCVQVAQTFLDLGYSVDVISSHNQTFVPTKPYAMFVGHRLNFDRLNGLLQKGCIKIAYLDTAHWVFNNNATYRRKLELLQRKGVVLKESHRLIELNLAIEHADYAVTYGNGFTLGTYKHSNKPVFSVPMSTCAMFPWPEEKNFASCRANFLWFGSHGFVHKGLDLVLEALSDMPECHLYVCGPVEKEKDFVKVYYKELYQTPNIHTIGWVDVNGSDFLEIVNKCVALVYPSCCEGQAGTVTTSMHAGLIPIISYESGVDVKDFGVILRENSIERIQDAVRIVSHLPVDRLTYMAHTAWQYARATYTRERFAAEFKTVVTGLMEQAEDRPAEETLALERKAS